MKIDHEKPEQPSLSQENASLPNYTVIFSHIFADCLLLVKTDEDRDVLRENGIEDVIFTHEEIKHLKGLPPDRIADLFRIKKVFPNCQIEDETKKEG